MSGHIQTTPNVAQKIKQWITSPLTKTSRVMLALGGIVLPILCHLWTIERLPFNNARWQSGELHDRVSFILTFRAGYVLYPFMAFAMVALAVYLFSRSNRSKTFWTGFGLANGLLVSVWYLGIFLIVLTDQDNFDLVSMSISLASLAGSALVPLTIWCSFTATKWLSKKAGVSAFSGGVVLSAVYIVFATIALRISDPNEGWIESLAASFAFPILFGVAFAPIWSLMTYAIVSIRWFAIDRQTRQFSLLQMLGLVTYAAGLITACRAAVRLSLDAYLQLPVQQPSGCYVASAAAMGHRRFVRSRPVWQTGGIVFRVNDQLQMLKAFEIALTTLCPRVHRKIRFAYNWIGPKLARRINRPWKADIAFTLLKPAEWIAALTMSGLLGRDRSSIERLYDGSGRPSK